MYVIPAKAGIHDGSNNSVRDGELRRAAGGHANPVGRATWSPRSPSNHHLKPDACSLMPETYKIRCRSPNSCQR